MELTAANLINMPFDKRDKHYLYPYNGPYTGEPQLYEILHLKEFYGIWGKSHLTIHKTCPACDGTGILIRSEWAICFHCLIAFDAFESYIDLTIDSEMEYIEEDE